MISAVALFLYGLLFVACLGIAVWLVSSLIQLVLGDAPFVPVADHAVAPLIKELNLNKTSVLIDIGCGNGKVLAAASRQFPDTQMVGIERNIAPYLMACWHTRRFKNVTITRKDFFACDFSQATHLYTYLFPKIMDQLLPQIQHQIRPGTVLVSCDFPFSEKAPIRTVDMESSGKKTLAKKLYVYEF